MSESDWLDEAFSDWGIHIPYGEPDRPTRTINDLKQAIRQHIEQEIIEAVDTYTNRLYKWGYIDSDFYTEPPSPQDRYLAELRKDTDNE